jgi:hypothetical protein
MIIIIQAVIHKNMIQNVYTITNYTSIFIIKQLEKKYYL